jgi:polar amino acid transport system substrate-binding protein
MVLFFSAGVHAEKVKLATGEWIPYTSAALEDYGEFTRLVSIVLNEMGVEPEYLFYPWRRCYDSVVKGRVWAAFPYSFTEERAGEVWYTDVLHYSTTVLFYFQKPGEIKQFTYNDIADLKNYRMGGVPGYFYEETFREAGLEVDYASKEISAMEKLKLGRIDLLPLNDAVGWNLIRNHFPDEADCFKSLPQPLSRNALHLIVTKNHPQSEQRLKRFNEALKRCRDKGLIKTK